MERTCSQCQSKNPSDAKFCLECGHQLKRSSDPLVGRQIGNHRLLERIGVGGMGVIYLAEHINLGQTYAIKLLHPQFAADEEVVERFRREAKIVAKLDHENIIRATDFGWLDDVGFYLVMEYLQGTTIKDIIKKGEMMSLERILEIFRQLLDALDVAHEKGIVHRDIKPENLFLIQRRGGELLKILDFGIAHIAYNNAQKDFTVDGEVYGSPTYMSPEQARGDVSKVDRRADLYSVGILLTELLTGIPPYRGATPAEVMLSHISALPPRLSELYDSRIFAPELEDLIIRALAKEPEDRVQSAHDFITELEVGIAKTIELNQKKAEVPRQEEVDYAGETGKHQGYDDPNWYSLLSSQDNIPNPNSPQNPATVAEMACVPEEVELAPPPTAQMMHDTSQAHGTPHPSMLPPPVPLEDMPPIQAPPMPAPGSYVNGTPPPVGVQPPAVLPQTPPVPSVQGSHEISFANGTPPTGSMTPAPGSMTPAPASLQAQMLPPSVPPPPGYETSYVHGTPPPGSMTPAPGSMTPAPASLQAQSPHFEERAPYDSDSLSGAVPSHLINSTHHPMGSTPIPSQPSVVQISNEGVEHHQGTPPKATPPWAEPAEIPQEEAGWIGDDIDAPTQDISPAKADELRAPAKVNTPIAVPPPPTSAPADMLSQTNTVIKTIPKQRFKVALIIVLIAAVLSVGALIYVLVTAESSDPMDEDNPPSIQKLQSPTHARNSDNRRRKIRRRRRVRQPRRAHTRRRGVTPHRNRVVTPPSRTGAPLPLPSKAGVFRLHITSSPSKAGIYLEGQGRVGETPYVLQFPHGTQVTLHIRRIGYLSQSIKWRAEKHNRVHLDLVVDPNY